MHLNFYNGLQIQLLIICLINFGAPKTFLKINISFVFRFKILDFFLFQIFFISIIHN